MKNITKALVAGLLMLSPMPAMAEYAVSTLDLNDAKGLLDKGFATATGLKVNVCVAVVDPSGVLIAFNRMDRAPVGCVDAAIKKARAAALFRVKTSVNMSRVNGQEPAIATLPNMVPLGGGVPVTNNDQVVGAVGVSGATNPVEVKIAEAIATSYGVVPEK